MTWNPDIQGLLEAGETLTSCRNKWQEFNKKSLRIKK